ncbi:hypothetical protein COOONC_03673 [Cooperia oncophora]
MESRRNVGLACVNRKFLLASGSDDRRVKVWNLAGECLTVVETGHQANVFAVEFLPAGIFGVFFS